ncbi:hypothetical protein [Shewanella khirikhana]|uniref:Alpha-L-rhamnosidase six-hairpin glycosidase domain-containing protein n=1 Tax=Shewanella khirikhana TaxID=1965282 RepID=A0ABN5TYA6_9GAMM|nr:hypothetical protein [Shewanella khirikhana]AZQ11855.1 hypothetical protein STH12_02786 [Shewanella khirikhana]
MRRSLALALCCLLSPLLTPAQAQTRPQVKPVAVPELPTPQDRWQINDSGIEWQVADAHEDHLEMAGEQLAAIIRYGAAADGSLILSRKLVWPMLRTLPNDTHASLIRDFDAMPEVRVGDKLQIFKLRKVAFNGALILEAEALETEALEAKKGGGLQLSVSMAPDVTEASFYEQYQLKNRGDKAISLSVNLPSQQEQTKAAEGVYGSYILTLEGAFDPAAKANGGQPLTLTLAPGEAVTFALRFSGRAEQEPGFAGLNVDMATDALKKRAAKVAEFNRNLVLETPDPVINQMFAFAKLRATESIFRTRGGLMHGPGGSRYYAAIWANDQAEYVNPFFPFLGDANGNHSAMNSFRHFARFMNPDYRPLPSSIIAEGKDIWAGVGDRGDCAMVAYGAGRYALARGSVAEAKELLPLIDWCLEYNRRQKTPEGVIASDTDELEGRFPAGKVNLSTNMLGFAALKSAANLYRSLGQEDTAKGLDAEAATLRLAIDSYFAATVEGFDTYQYYDGNDKLRAWIALPLVMGFDERKPGTLAALLSDKLWNENGIYTESGDKTFWDRATLYAFRGIFAAGETDTAMAYFKYYSQRRLLGEHVPYAVEAWPEGGQRHLSAESGLYARVVTEGLFAIEPTGFKSMTLAPRLPQSWDKMCLRHIRAFDDDFDICTERKGDGQQIRLIKNGAELMSQYWDGKAPLPMSL